MPVRGNSKVTDERDIMKYVVMLVAAAVLGLLCFSADNRQNEVEARTVDLYAGWNFVTFRPERPFDRQIGSIDVDGVNLFARFDNPTKQWQMIDFDAPSALWGFTVFRNGQPYIVYVEGTPGDGQLHGYWIQ